METKALIFDFGGTLDTGGRHWSHLLYEAITNSGVAVARPEFDVAYVEAERQLHRLRSILPLDSFRSLLLKKLRLELQNLAEKGLFPPAQIDDAASRSADYCYQYAKKNIDAIKPVLEALQKKYTLAVVSNFYGNLDTVLCEFDIRKYFTLIFDSEEVGKRKPDVAIFKHAIDALGMKPEEVTVVGDSYANDIKPALSLGCDAVQLKGEEWKDAGAAPGSPYPKTIEKLDELLNLFA